jgi:hypothetical protein
MATVAPIKSPNECIASAKTLTAPVDAATVNLRTIRMLLEQIDHRAAACFFFSVSMAVRPVYFPKRELYYLPTMGFNVS